MSSERLAGRRALVTGAASGVGRATAVRLAAEGAGVALVDVDADGLEGVRDEIVGAGGRALALRCDVSDEAAMSAAVESAAQELGGVDTVVANAGIQLHGEDAAVHLLAKSVWDQTLAVNLTGVFLTCKHGIAAILESGSGAVVVTGSPTGLRGGSRNYDAYSASKAGVFGLMRVMANEYGRFGVRVNAVVPGFTDTPLIRDHVSEARTRQIVDATPLGRQGRPEESAAVIAFLVSDDASFVTGAAYTCDGGRLAV